MIVFYETKIYDRQVYIMSRMLVTMRFMNQFQAAIETKSKNNADFKKYILCVEEK